MILLILLTASAWSQNVEFIIDQVDADNDFLSFIPYFQLDVQKTIKID